MFGRTPADDTIIFDSKLWVIDVDATLKLRGKAEFTALPSHLQHLNRRVWDCLYSARNGKEGDTAVCYCNGGKAETCKLAFDIECEDWRPRR